MSASTPIVETAAGRLEGLSLEGTPAFRGIRYGASTEGARRFMPPEPPQPWSGVRQATALGPCSPQGGQDIMFRLFPELERAEAESEDCLCLNVWTPSLASAKRPVMVWLHGGGYVTGSGGFVVYDGARLAHHEDVVAVTVNHRLNVFGFLDVAAIGGEKYARSANLGLQDIVAALQWVRTNIERFGGDPGNVTIYGESGGGGKVSTLMAMPAARGLFHRAIVQSGSALRQNTREVSSDLAQQFLAQLGLKSIDDLQRAPLEHLRREIAAALERAPPPGTPPSPRPNLNAMTLGPVVDGQWLPTHPFEPSAPAISADVPLLVGYNETEGTFFPGAALEPISEQRLRENLIQMLHTDAAGAERVVGAYRSTRPAADALDVLQMLQGDLFLGRSAQLQADRKAALARAPVYAYYFEWRSPVQGGRLKSFHTLEIPFVMRNLEPCAVMVGGDPELQPLADRISGAWSAFARNGEPSHAGLPPWPRYDEGRRATMILGTEPRVIEDPKRAPREALATLLRPAAA